MLDSASTKKLRKYGWFHIRKTLAELGLISASRDYQKFVVLSASRSGSNLLRDLLNSHSRTITFGEVFRTTDRLSWDCPVYDRFRSSTRRIRSLAKESPATLLSEFVYAPMPGNIGAVGFKLFYYHARDAGFQSIWDALRQDKSIKIIHLRRRNKFKRLVSLERAKQTNVWRSTDNDSAAREPLRISVDLCQSTFSEHAQWEADADDFFRDHESINVSYEALAKDNSGQMKRIQEFLGLQAEDVQATIFKQSSGTLRDRVENYAELQNHFRNSEWSEYFSD